MKLLQRLHSLLTHPAATLFGLFTGLATAAASIASVKSGLDSIAHVPGLPSGFVDHARQLSVTIGAASSISLIVASTGRSLLAQYSPSPQPPNGGLSLVASASPPLSDVPASVTLQPLQQQKAA